MMYNGFVYLAKSDTGHYKIGRSKNPYKRVQHFDTIMPVKVEIIHYFPCDNPVDAEKRLHLYASHHGTRVAGEWFEIDDYSVSAILQIRFFVNGEFDWPVNHYPEGGGVLYPCCDRTIERAVKENWKLFLDDGFYEVGGEQIDFLSRHNELLEINGDVEQ